VASIILFILLDALVNLQVFSLRAPQEVFLISTSTPIGR